MRYIPHDYQRRAQAFAFDKKKVLLNMGLGTGKTVVSGTVASLCLKNHGIKKVLIIATKRLITTTWPDEFAKWDHLGDLDYRIIQGSPAQRAKKLKGGDIHLINYENLVWLTTHLGRNWDYDMVIFDESSKMKAARTKRFRAMRKVIGTADRVLCLTGTPVSNGILDLWTQIFLLDGGIRLERTFTKYKTKYFDTDYFGFKWTPKPGAEDVITESVKDIALSMTSEEYLQLPPRTDISDRVYLPPGHMAAYAELKKEMLIKLESGRSVEAVNAAVLVGKCLQYTSGAAYVEEGWEWIHDEKINALSDLIEIDDGPTIVAYQYQHELERLQARFPQAKTISDSDIVVNWNWGKVPILLLHPASAAHGLNLQDGGSRIIWYSLPWSAELYLQTNGRLHRQGQKKPVFVHHLLASGTIDETILEALRRKVTIQDVLLEQLSISRRKTA